MTEIARPSYTYNAHLPEGLNSIHDGDTLHARIDLGCEVTITEILRFYGLNAPELNTAAGKVSLSWVKTWFTTNCPDFTFVLTTVKDRKEKYGRYLATIWTPKSTISLNEAMVTAGMAVPYFPK